MARPDVDGVGDVPVHGRGVEPRRRCRRRSHRHRVAGERTTADINAGVAGVVGVVISVQQRQGRPQRRVRRLRRQVFRQTLRTVHLRRLTFIPL